MEWSADLTRKRPASDDLLAEQPLSKRLELLNLGQEAKAKRLRKSPDQPPPSPAPQPPQQDAERMEVDNVTYISSIDAELAEEDSPEENPERKIIFIPDVEKKLTRMPYALLSLKDKEQKAPSKDLVLYSVPASLSVEEEKDSVRKAIIEARERVRRKLAEDNLRIEPQKLITGVEDGDGMGGVMINGVGGMSGVGGMNDNGMMNGDEMLDDPDAMDIE